MRATTSTKEHELLHYLYTTDIKIYILRGEQQNEEAGHLLLYHLSVQVLLVVLPISLQESAKANEFSLSCEINNEAQTKKT